VAEGWVFFCIIYAKTTFFIDVGANAGVYSVLAGKCCGTQSVACEPISETFERLQLQLRLNDVTKTVDSLKVCIGAEAGYVFMSNDLDTMNAVANGESSNTEKVELTTLDHVMSKRREKVGKCLLKVDVEGFEMSVIDGGENALANHVDALIIEINGAAERFGHTDDQIHDRVLSFGFKPYTYDPKTRTLEEAINLDTGGNTIYLKNQSQAAKACETARKFVVHSAGGVTI